MVQREKIYTTLKYSWAFLLCTVCFGIVCSFIATVDQDYYEFMDCFAIVNGYIAENIYFDRYHVYCGDSQICTCMYNSTFTLAFYMFALPIFPIYVLFRNRIIKNQYLYLFVFGEICVWALLYSFTLNFNLNGVTKLEYIYKFIAPMAIIMLALHSLPPKVLKGVVIVIGAIYGLLLSFLVINAFVNIFNNFMG